MIQQNSEVCTVCYILLSADGHGALVDSLLCYQNKQTLRYCMEARSLRHSVCVSAVRRTFYRLLS